jgi:hypothetical protein
VSLHADKSACKPVSARTLAQTVRILIRKGDEAADKAAHAAGKAEQFYIAAGLHLKQLKAAKPETETWQHYVEKHCHIGIRRAQELIAIADGRTTLEKVRASKAESMRRVRAHHGGAPLDPQAVAEHRTRSLQADTEAGKLPAQAAEWLTDHPDKTLVDYVAATAPPVGDPNAPEQPLTGMEVWAKTMGLWARGGVYIKDLRDELSELNRLFPALNPTEIARLTKIYGDVVVAAQNIVERLTGDRHARFQLLPGTDNGRDQTKGDAP